MNNKNRDKVIREAIRQEIKKRAHSYTPEWRFDEDNPDIGTALALAYTEMLAGTRKRFLRVLLKNKIAFYNELDAHMLSAVPSKGYVNFSLVNQEVEGVQIDSGTVVFADVVDEEHGQVKFETKEDLFVTPARLSEIYQTCDAKDMIAQLYDSSVQENFSPVTLFSLDVKNLQKHELFFSNAALFSIEAEGMIEISFFSQSNVEIKEEYLEKFCDTTYAVFEYYSVNGYQTFESQKLQDGKILLYKGKTQPAFEKTEIEKKKNYWIRCRIHNQKIFEKLYISEVKLATWNEVRMLDVIYGAEQECNIHEFFPFGERLDLYQEAYFGCNEVLQKKGAQITFSFGVDFIKVPLDTSQKENINWEWIMRRSDFKPDLEFDVTIEGVIWEYFNGTGWTRLFLNNEYSQVFSTQNGTRGQYHTLQFVCPQDIESTLVNAQEGYYIRARITKINNLYRMTGNYILPLLGNTAMRYQYESSSQKAEYVVFENNIERQNMTGTELSKKGPVYPFVQTEQENMGIYFAFETAPIGSPIKILCSISGNSNRMKNHLIWEYWNGKKWKALNLVDETENFSRTGLITFAGNSDMKSRRLFGKERYWIRVSDVENVYLKEKSNLLLPVIDGFYMNATNIEQVTKRVREYFTTDVYQENISFTLQDSNIYHACVYVEEQGHLTDDEIDVLERQDRIRHEANEDDDNQIWVKWSMVEDFSESTSWDRHYIIDPIRGELQFGNGKKGKMPYTSQIENVCIDYSVAGGSYTNLDTGMVNKMGRFIGFINEVSNPLPLTGGTNAEMLEEAIARNSAMIRHQQRAITPRDFEQIALLACRDIQYVKCFAGFDDTGKKSNGAVTLVVLQKYAKGGKKDFSYAQAEIMKYMSDKVSVALLDNHKFFVVEPKFVELRVRVELTVRDFNKVFQVKKAVLERLDDFLRPAGEIEGEGWEIGSFPNTIQIQNAISDITGIIYIKNIMMSVFANSVKEWREVDIDSVVQFPYMQLVSGEHEVIITVGS